ALVAEDAEALAQRLQAEAVHGQHFFGRGRQEQVHARQALGQRDGLQQEMAGTGEAPGEAAVARAAQALCVTGMSSLCIRRYRVLRLPPGDFATWLTFQRWASSWFSTVWRSFASFADSSRAPGAGAAGGDAGCTAGTPSEGKCSSPSGAPAASATALRSTW